MFLDIIVVLIIICPMVSGFRKGFVFTFIRTLGWIGAMILAFAAAPLIKNFLLAETELPDMLSDSLGKKLSLTTGGAAASADSFPQLISGGINSAMDSAVRELTESLSSLFLTLISIVAAFLLIKLIFAVLTAIFSKTKRSGFTGFFDGILGGIAGGIRGAIFVFIFLALLFPAVNLVSPESTGLILDSLNSSRFARTLYDSNFIVVLADELFSPK